jgi:hypothetical protein
MFIKLENGQPIGHPIVEQNFRLLFPNLSFAWPFLAEDIEPFGFGIYDFSSPLECGLFEKVTELSPVKDEYGIWRQTWAVEPMNEEEVAARTEQEWMNVRGQRGFRLAMCDWTQLPDAPLTNVQTANWATYRQSLRDITTQSDPFNILWPVSPNVESIPVSAA